MTATTAARRVSVRTALPTLAVVSLLRHTIAVHAVPDDQPWRTACPRGKPLWPNATGPSGRCAACGVRVGAPPYAVEAATLDRRLRGHPARRRHGRAHRDHPAPPRQPGARDLAAARPVPDHGRVHRRRLAVTAQPNEPRERNRS